MTDRSDPPRIPVVLLTGFLGTGKTTLLAALLADPLLARTAVLINELGEVGLDDRLVHGAGGLPTGDAAKDARIGLVLANGCVCCTVRDDLAVALDDLVVRAHRGEIPAFDRVIVETTGLADPVPILHAIASSPLTAACYAIEQVVCTVDAAADPARIERHRESLAQIVCADRLVITRGDLVDAATRASMEATVRRLNAGAEILHAIRGDLAARELLAAPAPRDASPAPGDAPPRQTAAGAGLFSGAGLRNRFHGDIHTTTLRFSGPSVWDQALAMVERTIAESPDEVLRVKGVLRFADQPDPMVVQYAGGRISPCTPLPGALAEGDAGFLVLIAASNRRPADPQSA